MQCRCVLYWQGTVNKALRMETEVELMELPGAISTSCPEAMGVNVFLTLRGLNIPFEVKPERKVLKVALLGYPTT